MADAASDDVPSVERAWSASNMLQSFSNASAVVQPGNFGRFEGEVQTASVSIDLVQRSETRKQQDDAAFVALMRPPQISIETTSPTGSRQVWSPSSSTLSVLSAAAASLKDKTNQVAQQQKRALSVFQQKGGLVSWLHGEMAESDEHGSPRSAAIVRPTTTTPTSPIAESSRREELRTPPSPRSPTNVKSDGRRRSMPNIASGLLLDNLLEKVAGSTSSPTAQQTSPPMSPQPRMQLRPTSTTSAPLSSQISRPRAATTDLPNRLIHDTNPALLKSQSAASLGSPQPPPEPRLSLDEVLSDEWSCTVLWAHLYSSATGRDHQHHQRLSFLIETTFRITPLYRKLAGNDGTFDREIDLKKLVSRLKRLHCRFLTHNEAATSGVPVASPAASHVKTQLSIAVHTLTDQRASSNANAQVEKAVSALLQLAREVEREFRVLGTRSYTNFADSRLYRDFVAHRSGPGNVAVLLRAARIPFYQQPNGVVDPICLECLVGDKASVFSRAQCQAFVIVAQPDGSTKFTDISPGTSGEKQTALLPTIEPFLNPSAHIHSSASKPIAFNFIAGSGVNMSYGAVMWLPVDQSIALGVEEMPGGLCIISKFPLVDSLRHFLCSLWKSISSKVEANDPGATLLTPAHVVSASLAMESHLLTQHCKVSGESDQFPRIDFKLDDLFDSLSLTNVLRFFTFVLLEKKIVLVASSYTTLFSVSEALRTLLYPLVWSHVYVPVLPLALKDCLHCPTPFIFGLHDSYVRRSDMPRPSNDLVVVNLDRDSLTGGGDIFLPPVRQSMMREELFRLCKPHLITRDSVDNFEGGNYSFPAHAIRRVFLKHLREILVSLEPCINRFQLNGQCVCVVDDANSSLWPADTVRFCSAMLHTQAVSTYLASPLSDDRVVKPERVFV